MKTQTLTRVWGAVAALAVGMSGCAFEKNMIPDYDLTVHQDRKVMIWVEALRSAAADPDAVEQLTDALRNHMVGFAGIKPKNVYLFRDFYDSTSAVLLSPEAATQRAGAELMLFVQIEAYELIPLHVRDYYSGRMLTRAILMDVVSGQQLWPRLPQGKLHDIVIELGQGGRSAVLSQMSASTAHCVMRNFYPIPKLIYRNSDERIAIQEAFEMETF